MKKFWEFLNKGQNLAIIVALGSGLAFLWTQINVGQSSPNPVATPNITQQVGAAPIAPLPIIQNVQSNNGTAIIANGSAVISINQRMNGNAE